MATVVCPMVMGVSGNPVFTPDLALVRSFLLAFFIVHKSLKWRQQWSGPDTE